MTVELPTNASHRLELRLDGYYPFRTMIVSVRKKDAPYVRFGLQEDAGHYRELRFSPSIAPLKSTLVPKTRGVDLFGDFGERVLILDRKLTDGLITPEEHARILTQLIVTYEQ